MKKYTNSGLRRILTLLAALLLITAVLAGCNRNSASDDPTDPPVPTVTEGELETLPPTITDPVDETEAPTEPEPTALPDAVMGTVTADQLNVRSNPSTSGTVLKMLPKDTRVTVLEQRTIDKITWGRITEGWVMMNYIRLDGEPQPTEPETNNTGNTSTGTTSTGTTGNATITASELNIRKSGSADSEKVGTYKKGDKVKILEVKGNWGKTDKGWISMKYVKMDASSGTTPDIGSNDSTTNSEIVSNGKTATLGYGVVDLGALNVRTGPGTKYDKIGTVTEGKRFAYYEKKGNWVRIKDGWVSTSYFYLEGTTAEDATSGTVTTNLNVRTGPGSSFKSNGSYKEGESVKILAQVNGWGYTSKGWISMKYVKQAEPTYTTGTGTITASELNIRKEASKDAEKNGTYKKGDKVTITEIKDGFGKTDKGWISMKYVKMDASAPAETEPQTGTNTTFKTGEATVKVNSSLTIRKEAKADAEKVGSYKNGDKVTITKVEGEWGYTEKGWINLKYVVFS